MRIAMLTNNYKPYVGGVPVSIEHLAEELRKLGHIVYIFAPSYPGQKEDPFVIRYPSFPVQIAGAPIPNASVKLFYRRVRDLCIDLIHVHHPAITGNVALLLRKRLEIPVVFTYHTCYEEYLYYVKTLQQIERCTGVLHKYLKYFCNCCDMVLAPTPEIKDHLLYEKRIKTSVGILPTGLPQENFYIDEKAVERIRRQYQDGADYMFCTVARLAKEKNLDFLLESLCFIKKKFSVCRKTFRYLLIGEGLERKHLMEKCSSLELEKEVVFLGNVDNREIKNYLAASDLFLFSSKSETQGIVVLEAMAAGIPVAAVDATGIRDVVETKKNGILTMEDPVSFAQAVEWVLSDQKLYKTLCTGAKNTAMEYTEDTIAYLAEGYYLEVLNFCKKQSIHAILV